MIGYTGKAVSLFKLVGYIEIHSFETLEVRHQCLKISGILRLAALFL